MQHILIDAPAQLAPYLPALAQAKVIGLDLETTGLDPHLDRIRLVQMAAEDLPVLVIDCFSFLPEGLPLLRQALMTPAVKVLQNAKFDLQFLLPFAIHPQPVFDTMLAARLLYMPGMARRANLQTLAQTYLGMEIDKTEQQSDWSGPLRDKQVQYAAEDAAILPRLRHAMVPQIVQAGLTRIADIEFHCVRAVAQMETAGIHLDLPQWEALTRRTEAERDLALESIYAYTGRPMAQMTLWGGEETIGLNLDSNTVVLDLLRRQGIEVENTSKFSLYPHREHPFVQALTAYRKASKALTSFLLPIPSMLHPKTGRLHPQYGQVSVSSGRMSCGNPNIQQIPRDRAFRACFTAPEGRRLIIADYSQIELRVAAQVSGDARMTDAYRRGEDLHQLTASLLSAKPMAEVTGQERQAAKAVNFGLIYGMGAAGLQQYAQQAYGVEMTLAQATLFRKRFFDAYEGIAQWHDQLKRVPAKEGRTLTGRRFAFSSQPSLPELSNAPVQGTAADIVKHALGLLAGRLQDTGTDIVAVVHDEILLECPQAQAEEMAMLLRETMEMAGNSILSAVPVLAESIIGENWAAK